MKERILLKGEKVSSGIGIGRLFFIDRKFVSIPHISLTGGKEETDAEILRFKEALSSSEQELIKILELDDTASEIASILEAHRMMLTDQVLSDMVVKMINEKKINAEWAVLDVFQKLEEMLSENSSNYYTKAKIADLEIVRDKIIYHLTGVSSQVKERIGRAHV